MLIVDAFKAARPRGNVLVSSLVGVPVGRKRYERATKAWSTRRERERGGGGEGGERVVSFGLVAENATLATLFQQ